MKKSIGSLSLRIVPVESRRTDLREPASREGAGRVTESLRGNTQGTPSPINVSTKQQRIAELARQIGQEGLTTLNHYLDMEWMKEAYRRVRKESAPGIDGQTAEQYGEGLEANLRDLLGRAKRGNYFAPPVRRVQIPKDGKETRPIGVPTIEDKVLQRATVMLLEPIYEEEFYDFSYGFRPGRSAHQALEYLWKQLMNQKIEWVVDLDIQKFFDTLDHQLLRKMIRWRVQDGVIVRLIDKWLKAGVIEQGSLSYPEEGTPQGGVISPTLSNVFLHEVLDRWFAEEVKPRLKGRAFMVRYADDGMLGFEREDDARRVMAVLAKRFGRYHLSLHPQKTRLIPFGRNQPQSVTFEFLGFTHYWGTSRKGWKMVKRKTASKRLSRSLKAIKRWCQENRHFKLTEQHRKICEKLRGHFAYYGITGNSESLGKFKESVKEIWKKWLDRRSRRRGGMTWERFNKLLRRYFPLPPPRVIHSIYAAKP